MPFVVCEQHGGDTAPHLCRCSAERVWKHLPIAGTLKLVDLDDFFLMGYVCADCLAALEVAGLSEFLARHKGARSGVYDDAELDRFLDLLDFQPACRHYVNELTVCEPPLIIEKL